MTPYPKLTAALIIVCVAGLTGCVATTPSDDSGTARPAPPSADIALIPDGSAEENLALFAAVVSSVWDTPEKYSSRAYVDALIAAGFEKSAMQATADISTVGNPAESIQFSVLWKNDCLIGQVGPATGAPHTVVAPAISDGRCLVGRTNELD